MSAIANVTRPVDDPSTGPRRVEKAAPRYSLRRRAFCPLCGLEQMDKPVSEVGSPEAALCVDRCAVAWQALAALRRCEAGSEVVAARRRVEWEATQRHTPTLSELLLGRWRAGDWAVAPEDLLQQLSAGAFVPS